VVSATRWLRTRVPWFRSRTGSPSASSTLMLLPLLMAVEMIQKTGQALAAPAQPLLPHRTGALTRLTRGWLWAKGYRQALVVMCPPRRSALYSPSGVPRCDGVVREASLSLLRPDPNSNPDANPHLELESSRVSPPHTGREKVGSPTLQAHQDIIVLPWLWFEVADQPWPGGCCCKLLQGARALLNMPLAVIIDSRCPPHAYVEV
jgi:hypothetical protein